MAQNEALEEAHIRLADASFRAARGKSLFTLKFVPPHPETRRVRRAAPPRFHHTMTCSQLSLSKLCNTCELRAAFRPAPRPVSALTSRIDTSRSALTVLKESPLNCQAAPPHRAQKSVSMSGTVHWAPAAEGSSLAQQESTSCWCSVPVHRPRWRRSFASSGRKMANAVSCRHVPTFLP